MCNETWPPLLPPWSSSMSFPISKPLILQSLEEQLWFSSVPSVAVTNYPSPPPLKTKMKDTECLRKIQDSSPCSSLCLNCLLKEKLPLLYSNLLSSVYRFRVAWWCSPAIDIAWAKETRRDWSSWHFVCLCACLDCGQKMTWLHISLWTLMSLMHWCVSRSRTTKTPKRKWMNV